VTRGGKDPARDSAVSADSLLAAQNQVAETPHARTHCDVCIKEARNSVFIIIMLDDDESDSGISLDALNINEDFAKAYKRKKEREELSKRLFLLFWI
jgi:hypothetical protein